MSDENTGVSSRKVITPDDRNWASVRTILDALILMGIVWIVSSQVDGRVQTATIISQVSAIQANISDVPALRDRVTHIETVQNELIRRQAGDDALHARIVLPEPRVH